MRYLVGQVTNDTCPVHVWCYPHSLTKMDNYKRTTVTNKRTMIPTTVTVRDMSGQVDKFTLDRNGFQLHRHELKIDCPVQEYYGSEENLQSEYYPKMEQLIKDV